jgi:large subunit ribosomal protein L30|tara:strand:+ start:518 stop:700 length:183 start_codon:yes stop_codon:yes gene_type:complete
MAKIRIRQTKSSIGVKPSQRATLKSLGLRKINDVVEKDDRPSVRGMIRKISHLIEHESLI